MARTRTTRLGNFDPEDGNDREPEARTPQHILTLANARLTSAPNLQNTWVRGEVSGLTQHVSGNWFFALKDEYAALNAVMFARENARVKLKVADEMELLVRGDVVVYPKKSTVQLRVFEMRQVGRGDLAAQFERLKRELAAEGCFDEAIKQSLPDYPRTIGIVTSVEGAALHDIINVARDRNPAARLLVADARVQGEDAAAQVVDAIARLDARAEVDVIIVARGGGPIEDLWAFNEAAVVRAVAACTTPIVSGVGHETDTTLTDLAADKRAATPSQAAHFAVPDARRIEAHLAESRVRLAGALMRTVPDKRERVDAARTRLAAALERLVPEKRQAADDMSQRLVSGVRLTAERHRERVHATAARLDALSPLSVLGRGYGVARKHGTVVRKVDDLAAGDDLELILRDGIADARVRTTRKEGPHVRQE